MVVDLDPKTRALIQERVATGRFSDESEVVREAIRLLDQRERRLAELRAELAIGMAQIERGDLIDFTPDLMDELCRESEENARRGKPIKDAVKP